MLLSKEILVVPILLPSLVLQRGICKNQLKIFLAS